MAIFLSTFKNKIDKTGRVSVPSSFRLALKSEDFQGVVLYRSFVSGCVEGCSLTRMEDLSNAVDNMDVFSEAQDDMSALLFADARQLSFDSAGRVVIPEDLLEHAGISGEAMFVGKGKTFQVWDSQAFAKHQQEILEKARANRPTLKIEK